MYHSFGIHDFKDHSGRSVVFYDCRIYCIDRLPVVQLLFHIVRSGGMGFEYFQKKKAYRFSCILCRLGDIICDNGAYHRLGVVFGNMPDLYGGISHKVLVTKKIKSAFPRL